MLLSRAPISNSRALIKEAILRPLLAGAEGVVADVPRWTGIERASWFFCRFRACEVRAGLSNAAFRFWPATCEDEAILSGTISRCVEL